MADPVTTVLGGIAVAAISVSVGKFLGGNGKVKDTQCKERRESCLNLVTEKVDNLITTVEGLKKDVSKINCKMV